MKDNLIAIIVIAGHVCCILGVAEILERFGIEDAVGPAAVLVALVGIVGFAVLAGSSSGGSKRK